MPVALAQQVTPVPETPKKAKEIIKHTTLLTESETSGLPPYTGEGRGINSIIPTLVDDSLSYNSANVIVPATVRKLEKENYRPNEEIEVVIENGVTTDYKTELVDGLGTKVAVETEEVVTGDAKVITVTQPSSFRPGRYTLKVTDEYGGVSEQDFRWGVLAINPDKSVYAPNETATLAIAVLDDAGNMVCDAQVELEVRSAKGDVSSLSTDNGKIKVNPECESHDFTLNPDYDAMYKVAGAGTYAMKLKAQTKNGAYEITDSFEVREQRPFDVKRISATRIYPPHTYPVTMEITANQDFEGTVTETVPANFTISKPGEEVVTNAEIVEKEMQKEEVAGASTSASESAAVPQVPPPSPAKQTIQSPENLPAPLPFASPDVIGYATLNNLVDSASVKAVLGVSIPALSLPFSGMYRVTQEFGQSLVYDEYGHGVYDTFGMHGHDGTDFAMPQGTPILAVDDGKILLAGTGDYGTTVVIQHSWGRSYYGHLSSVAVKEGDEIQRGMTIAKSGNTGLSTGPHLHFGIKPDTNESDNGFYGKVDPAYYIGLKAPAGQVLGISTKVSEEAYPAPVNTDVQILTWKIKVKKGEKIKIGYNYLAPRLSPQFYTLGPAVFTDTTGKEIFHEERKWQIAADALEYKFKRGSFTKSTCTATCTQRIGGVGFKPKAVIFEWTTNTSEGFTNNVGQYTGMGFATSSTEERAVSYWSDDAATTSDTGKLHSATKAIVIQGANGSTLADADFVSFDTDGFTLSWDTNNASAYIIHYTALGGADVADAKAGSFTLASSGATQSFTDPGFQPDFVMFLANGGGATDTNLPHASMSAGFASSPTKEAGVAMMSLDAEGTAQDSCRKQDHTASIILLAFAANCTTPIDAQADLASFDATGFTLNVTDTPGQNTPIYYLALKGGQYDVGAFLQPTSPGQQSVYTGFRPSGLMTMAASTSATTALQTTGATLSTGGGSPGTTEAWCNDTTGTECYAPGGKTPSTNGWTERRKITIDNDASNEDLTDFPLLVKLDSTRIDYAKTQNSGQDIRFVDPSDPGTVLSHEIESWDEAGNSYVWVKVPQLDARSNTDTLWMYYGNPSASDGQNPTGVWNSNYVGVWHLKEDPTGSAPQMQESTYNSFDATSRGTMESGDSVTAKIGKGLEFDGTAEYIDVPHNSVLNLADSFTISFWMKFTGTETQTWPSIIRKGAISGSNGWLIYEDSSFNTIAFKRDGVDNQLTSTNTVDASTLRHYTIVYNKTNGTLTGFVNGAQDGQLTSISFGTNSDTNVMTMAWGDGYANIQLDEPRISTTNRSADWIEAEYLSTNDSMNTFSSAEVYGVAGTQAISQGAIWSDDVDGFATSNNATSSRTDTVIQFATSPPPTGNSRTVAKASLTSIDPTGFSLQWTEADTVARQVFYWAAGSVTASQDDFRWYKNIDALQPTTALEDESQSTIIAKNKPYVRLRTNISVGGNGMNASTQGYKLQYYAQGSESGVGGTTDWCNDTTGVTCTAPLQPGDEVPASTPTDWCNDTTGVTCTTDWSSRRKITFNNASSSAALTDFPVLVKLDSSRIDYSKTQNSGQDIRFIDPSDPTVVLNHEIESWNESGTSYVWVKVPTINGRSDVDYIWMYYGNSGTADGQAATSVWDTNFKGIWHMKEDPTTTNCPTTKEVCDSTTNANNGDANGTMTSGDQVSGKVNGSLDFEGTDDHINVPDANSLDIASSFTISTWIYPRAFPGAGLYDTVFYKGFEYYLELNNTDEFNCGIGGDFNSNNANLAINTWYNLTCVLDDSGNTMNVYVNGVLNNTYSTASAPAPNTAPLYFARMESGQYTNAIMDEFRLSNTARTADWVRAEYLTSVDQFNTYGTEFSYADTKQTATGWGYRRKITFNNSASAENLTNFPVLVKLDNSTIDYNKAQDDGGDIRFVDASNNTVVLPHEIESWNENGTSYVWVQVPQIDSGSQTDYIWMYYGNPTASDGQNATGVWDSNFKGIWHLREDPAVAGAGGILDATSNNVDGTDNGSMNAADQVTGKIDGSLDFDGSDDYIDVPETSFDSIGAMTLSVWVKPGNIAQSGFPRVIQKGDDTGATRGFGIGQDATDGTYGGWYQVNHTTTEYSRATSVKLSNGTWYQVTMVYNGATNVDMYVNGVLSNAGNSPSWSAATDDMRIADKAGGGGPYTGGVDEVRISNTNRSADWIEAEYNNQTDQMNSFSEEQPYTTGGTAVAGWKDVADPWCSASTSCNTSWAYRKKITFNNTSTEGSTLFTDGFESGSFNAWPDLSGNMTIDTNTVNKGMYSAKMTMSGSATHATAPIATPTLNAHMRGYSYVSSASTQFDMLGLGNATADKWFTLYRSSSGFLCIWNGATSTGTCSTTQTVPTGAWHEYELYVTINSTAGELKAYYDGSLVSDLNLTGQNTGTDNLDRISIGDGNGSRTATTYFDNISLEKSPTDLTNFPVLVKLDSSRIDYTKTQNSGQDIRFVDPSDPTSVLNHEIESWDENGASYVWVQVPQLDARSSSDSIWMYYGNASASDGQNATGVWDSNFKGIWHLNRDPTTTTNCNGGAGSLEECDSTSNNNDTDSTGTWASGDLVDVKVGKGLNFQGTNSYQHKADNATLDIADTVTVSAWIKADNLSGYHVILVKGENYVLQTVGTELQFAFFAGSWQELRTSGANLQTGTTYHFTARFNDITNVLKLYINGTPALTTTSNSDMIPDSQPFNIGAQGYDIPSSEWWDGQIDEARVSAIDRSDEWILAEYLTSSDQMNTFGAEETQNSTVWRFKNNASVTNGQAITTAVLGSSTTGNQLSYQESNPTTLNPVALAAGERREFDFALDSTNASPRRTYYFRLVTAEGEPLTNYTRYPSIIVGVPHNKEMRHGKWTNYKQKQPFTF